MYKMYGGKADSLLKLKLNGFLVPEFFVVTSDDYKQFLMENNLLKTIECFLMDGKRDLIGLAIMDGKFSEDLECKIRGKFKDLSCEFVSVRSSALNEDGKDKAFAGQYDSYLNVVENDLLEKIKLCWISFYGENVNEYCENNGVFGMNVIVQEMIVADYAGVAFSFDPTSSTNNYSLIEMVNGLGENLVSGKVTPTKFLVRRTTGHIDLKIGHIDVDDKFVEDLEVLVLQIESLYECPVDVEYAIKDGVIYILQARFITAKSAGIRSFSLALTRPKSIIEMEINFRGEYEGIKSVTRDLYYFKPLFIYNVNQGNVGMYYNVIDLEEDPRLMYYYMDMDFDKLKLYFDEVVMQDIVYIQDCVSNRRDVDFYDLIERVVRIYPFVSLGQLAGHFEKISLRLKDFLIYFRNNYDFVVHVAIDFIIDGILDKLPFEYKEYINFLTFDECMNNLPSLDVVKLRKNGFVYFGDLFVTDDYKGWLFDNNISIKMDNEASLSGTLAYPKGAIGKVCVVYSEKDFDKFEKGDILVTPMTVPKFVKIIKIAGGIITDEGGVTCHASIIARELAVPCVVGCKNATMVLKDGDVVKIDGASGDVIKLS